MRSPVRVKRRAPVLAAATALILAAACDPGQLADPAGEASLTIVPDSVTLTHIGQRFAFSAQLTGDPGPGSLRWEAPGLSYLVYALDSDGTVTARDNGQAQLWAEFIKSSEYGKLTAMATVRVQQVARDVEVLGGDQRAATGLSLPESVGVRMVDAGGTPLRASAVRFEVVTGGGRVFPEEVQTDSAGLASAVWTLGGAPGRQTLVASAGSASVEIAATALEPDAAVEAVEVQSGAEQWEWAGKALPDPVVVRVSDGHGRAVPAVTVRFEPGPGSGRAEPASVQSDSLGLAAAVWTLGPEQGPMRLMVSAGEGRTEIEATALSDEGVCARTPAVSAEIVSRLPEHDLAGCAEVTEAHLQDVTYLGLSNRGIRRLQSGDFAGLPNLETIGLEGNQLTELPPDIFAGLARLRFLRLSRNQFSSLPPDIFAGLSNLEYFTLTNTPLTELPPDIFAGLTSLGELWLHQNQLTELPPGIFAGLTRLGVLAVGLNQLAELPPGIFDDLSNLEHLYLNRNQLASLPPGIFDGLSKLEHLRLSNNRLTGLPPQLFAGTPSLLRLFLDENRLTELPPGIFDGPSELNLLVLQENRLTKLPPGIFDGLSSLEQLRLWNNNLTRLPPEIFDGLSSLEEMLLAGNSLARLPPGIFAGLSNLVVVDLTFNPGTPFPVRAELGRTDAGDLLAPQPASVAMRVPSGAPFAFRMPVSVQRGTGSGEFLSVAAGDTASAPVVVRQASGSTGAVHVGFGLAPQLPAGFRGLEVVPGEEMVLFAESGNGSPVIRATVPAHRLQVDGPSAEVALGDYFFDPDGDSLFYDVVTGDGGVAGARTEDGTLWLDPGLEGTTEVQVTAADSGGLRATQRVEVTVGPAPDPDAFNIEVIFGPGFTDAQRDSIRMAAGRWMEVVTGDLPDVPIDGHLCGWNSLPRIVGSIDDLVIYMILLPRERQVVGTAGSCGTRAESGLAFTGVNAYSGYWLSPSDRYSWYNIALHEVGHVLGIGSWFPTSSPSRKLFRDRDTDPHFAGPLAVAAFNAAGGAGYTGGKVPVEDIRPGKWLHWRRSVMRDDIMTVGGRVLSAITVQALADLGHGVDVRKADPYTLPSQVQGDVAGGAAEAEGGGVEVLTDRVIEGPVVVVDKDGNVVRVIRR